MIDHLGIPVSDYARSKAFYGAALAPLGHAMLREFTPAQTGKGSTAGFGSDQKPAFWIVESGAVVPGLHIAFEARSRALVDAFHAAALAAGGTDNGAPGLRPEYHPGTTAPSSTTRTATTWKPPATTPMADTLLRCHPIVRCRAGRSR